MLNTHTHTLRRTLWRCPQFDATHPPTGPVEGTLEHRPQLAVRTEAHDPSPTNLIMANDLIRDRLSQSPFGANCLQVSAKISHLCFSLLSFFGCFSFFFFGWGGGLCRRLQQRSRRCLISDRHRVWGVSDLVVSTYLVCWANPGTLVKMFMSALRANAKAP